MHSASVSLETSQRGDLFPWLRFFMRVVRRQARDAEARTVRLVELQHELRSELRDEGRASSVVRLVENLFAVPIVTAARAEELLGVTRPTAHAAIDALVERGDLAEVTGRYRGRIYEAPRTIDTVYDGVQVEGGEPNRQLSGGSFSSRKDTTSFASAGTTALLELAFR